MSDAWWWWWATLVGVTVAENGLPDTDTPHQQQQQQKKTDVHFTVRVIRFDAMLRQDYWLQHGPNWAVCTTTTTTTTTTGGGGSRNCCWLTDARGPRTPLPGITTDKAEEEEEADEENGCSSNWSASIDKLVRAHRLTSSSLPPFPC